jgi:hypothetical protein
LDPQHIRTGVCFREPVGALDHHQEDSTHIALDVVTVGLTLRDLLRKDPHSRPGRAPEAIIKLKPIWTVSVAALNRRLYSVGMSGDWQYRTLCIEIAKRRYRKHEPRETSYILPSVFGALHEDGISRADVVRALNIPRAELEQLMFGLAMTSIEGGRKKAGAPAMATLSLVK